jgi:hypothetical protein
MSISTLSAQRLRLQSDPITFMCNFQTTKTGALGFTSPMPELLAAAVIEALANEKELESHSTRHTIAQMVER